MSADKHRNDQASRKLRGPRQPAGEPMGMHVTTAPGKQSACRCGGCKGDGTRYSQPAQVRQL